MLAPKPGQFPLSQFDTLGKFFAHLGKKNWRLSLKSLEVCWGYSYKVLHLLRSETKDQRGPGTRALSYSPFPPVIMGKLLSSVIIPLGLLPLASVGPVRRCSCERGESTMEGMSDLWSGACVHLCDLRQVTAPPCLSFPMAGVRVRPGGVK